MTLLQSGKMLHTIIPTAQFIFFLKRFSHRHHQCQIRIFVEFRFQYSQTLAPIGIIKTFIKRINDKHITSGTDISSIIFCFFLQPLQIVFIFEVEDSANFSNNSSFILVELNAKAQIHIRFFNELRGDTTNIVSLATAGRSIDTIGFFSSAHHIVHTLIYLLPRQ